MLKKSSALKLWSEDHQVPYLVLDNTWVGYDNAKSIGIKVFHSTQSNQSIFIALIDKLF